MQKYLLFFLLSTALLSACDKSEYNLSEVELIVASEMVVADDGGGEKKPFMQVKEVDKNWEHWLMIHGVNGFEYEPGYEYLLKVEKKVRKENVLYLPSFEYTLINIISKTKK